MYSDSRYLRQRACIGLSVVAQAILNPVRYPDVPVSDDPGGWRRSVDLSLSRNRRPSRLAERRAQAVCREHSTSMKNRRPRNERIR